MINGTERSYWANGKLGMEIPRKNGKWHGIVKDHCRTGEIYSESPYINGERHGTSKIYYKSGEVKFETQHLYGRKVTKEEYREHELIEELAKLKEH